MARLALVPIVTSVAMVMFVMARRVRGGLAPTPSTGPALGCSFGWHTAAVGVAPA